MHAQLLRLFVTNQHYSPLKRNRPGSVIAFTPEEEVCVYSVVRSLVEGEVYTAHTTTDGSTTIAVGICDKMLWSVDPNSVRGVAVVGDRVIRSVSHSVGGTEYGALLLKKAAEVSGASQRAPEDEAENTAASTQNLLPTASEEAARRVAEKLLGQFSGMKVSDMFKTIAECLVAQADEVRESPYAARNVTQDYQQRMRVAARVASNTADTQRFTDKSTKVWSSEMIQTHISALRQMETVGKESVCVHSKLGCTIGTVVLFEVLNTVQPPFSDRQARVLEEVKKVEKGHASLPRSANLVVVISLTFLYVFLWTLYGVFVFWNDDRAGPIPDRDFIAWGTALSILALNALKNLKDIMDPGSTWSHFLTGRTSIKDIDELKDLMEKAAAVDSTSKAERIASMVFGLPLSDVLNCEGACALACSKRRRFEGEWGLREDDLRLIGYRPVEDAMVIPGRVGLAVFSYEIRGPHAHLNYLDQGEARLRTRSRVKTNRWVT